MADAGDLAEDGLWGGRVRLLQPRRGHHRAGTDAVLLAAAAPVRAGDVVMDLGAGTGAVGLMTAARAALGSLVLVERDPALAEICGQNIALNGLETLARVVTADLLGPAGERRAAGLEPGSADLVVTNPPFLETARARLSPDRGRAAAHALPAGGLEAWLRTAHALLRSKGRIALIHRADRIGDCLKLMEGRFGAVRLRPVHPRVAEPAIRILITAVKGSRAPSLIAPGLVLHEADGSFTPEAVRIHQGEAWLK